MDNLQSKRAQILDSANKIDIEELRTLQKPGPFTTKHLRQA